MFNFTALIFSLFANYWIWQIFTEKPIIFILVLTVSLQLFVLVVNKKLPKTSLIILLIILFAQSFDAGSNIFEKADEKRLTEIRINLASYQETNFQILGRQLRFPTFWLENKSAKTALLRFESNIFENLDINKYFFAGHPRERAGIKETEKFPYALLPFFIIGLVGIYKRNAKLYFILFTASIVLVSLVGGLYSLGPYLLFPFIAVAMAAGFVEFKKFTPRNGYGILFAVLLFVIIALSIVQTVYAK